MMTMDIVTMMTVTIYDDDYVKHLCVNLQGWKYSLSM